MNKINNKIAKHTHSLSADRNILKNAVSFWELTRVSFTENHTKFCNWLLKMEENFDRYIQNPDMMSMIYKEALDSDMVRKHAIFSADMHFRGEIFSLMMTDYDYNLRRLANDLSLAGNRNNELPDLDIQQLQNFLDQAVSLRLSVDKLIGSFSVDYQTDLYIDQAVREVSSKPQDDKNYNIMSSRGMNRLIEAWKIYSDNKRFKELTMKELTRNIQDTREDGLSSYPLLRGAVSDIGKFYGGKITDTELEQHMKKFKGVIHEGMYLDEVRKGGQDYWTLKSR